MSVDRGYDHAAVHYTRDEELLGVAVPFLEGGLAAGEPTLVSLEPERAELVRGALPPSAPVEYLATGDLYVRPAAAIKSYRAMMAGFVDGGAAGIRIFGEIPPAAIGAAWDGWARYESAVNHAYGEFPLRSMCAYDTRTTPRHVLDDVARTHPFVATPGGGHHTNTGYVDPRSFLAGPRPMTPLPIELTAPLAELADPRPADARRAVVATAPADLPAAEVDDLVLAVSELVDNALRHGHPPRSGSASGRGRRRWSSRCTTREKAPPTRSRVSCRRTAPPVAAGCGSPTRSAARSPCTATTPASRPASWRAAPGSGSGAAESRRRHPMTSASVAGRLLHLGGPPLPNRASRRLRCSGADRGSCAGT
ncbi:MEDS domain-containing protein [Amycolatopsis sp. A133]|nr:MEDS domain-containing protein [Amycolatopsis sp. A133]MDQ7807331.1 MEDS domain-containing protein [Amycolatopsis sp. A133]